MMKFRRWIAATLTMVMMVLLFSNGIVQAANDENGSITIRQNLVFLEGKPGDNHLVYTYYENGEQYKVVENADANFMNVNSTVYIMDAKENYVKVKSERLNIQPNGDGYLTITDAQGISETSEIDTLKTIKSVDTVVEENKVNINRAYTDPGTGEWVTKVSDGSSYIYNMTVSVIGAVLGAAIGGKVGAAIGTIAAEYFKKGAEYAYYHVVHNWMMSKLNPATVIIREAVHTTYYLDAGHRYLTGSDYYEYDGRW